VVPDQGYLDIAARLLDDALAQAPSASSSRPEVWDEQSWFEDLASRGHGDFSSAAREILEWAESNDVSAHYRASGKVGGIDFLPPTDQAAWLFSMWTNGVLIAENNHLKKAAAFATQDSRRELLRRLNEIPGVSLNSDNPDGYQRFPLTAVAANLASFLDVYRWVLDELTRSSAESAVSQPHG